jgi:hypothetical protein
VRRAACLAAAATVVAAGLLLRLPRWPLPLPIHHYGGGVLWGAMLLFLVAALRPPRWHRRACVIASCLLAALIEASRLVHAPALDVFRRTLPGELLLGRIFSVWNLLAYALGIAVAAPLIRSHLREHDGAVTPP